ncbi:CheR family methyltransferase [Sphingobacterium multivorum]|uniref:CheR family methyltransferase n=1 Tax=Sphingobacterium multivorum TaxID=28454 RepID=UPI00301A252F
MKKKGEDNKGKLSAAEQLQQIPTDFLVVGIGTSAGGVHALRDFFRQVPSNSFMAFVVILHLSPDHDSELTGILQLEIEMPVVQVLERTKIAPDHIYVVSPSFHLTMDESYISVTANQDFEDRRAPVDIFLRTLADHYGPRAISVILSGTGANGSMGLKRIKERGGATFVQNPRQAEFNEMPRNAIATELVDEVLNVEDIPARIVAYRNSIGSVQIIEEVQRRPELQQQALRDIFTQLRVRTGHDFSNYKRPTLLRRIERRINVHSLPDLPAYATYLHEHLDETHALLKDLLISVTNFFRDSKAFKVLEEDVIPKLFAGKTSADQVRIWVAGCATGEEAYSLAIICAEQALSIVDAPKVQIFATDIDESAIAAAREGFYTLNDAADVSADRLRRFFTRDGDGYRVRREIREMILFANHNFLNDPPFSKLDLISCRNVLIYLNSTAQERVIETFHFALRPKKFLFLGTSESVDSASDLYTAYNRDHHIFQTREITLRSYPVPDSVPQFQFSKADLLQKPEERENRTRRRSFGELHQKMLEQYAPPSVVVNEEYDIVHMSERAGKYFEFTGGEPTQNLLKLVVPQIRLELRAALYQSVQNKTAIEARNIRFSMSGQAQSLDIQIRPVFEEGDSAKGFILVIFKPSEETTEEGETLMVASDEPMARQLEEELVALKAQLRNSIEHHEYQAEELKASNEELQAMNEELRSAAEELETSKEELQSINEELRTVNQELKVKIDETSVTSNNLQNLINSANVGTIFLDRSFSIRLFTPAILDIFNLKSGDYGRPVTDITNKLQYNGLLQDAETVLEKLTIVEREVMTTDNRSFMMRLLPYRTSEDRINGVVITFFDITKRRESEEALRQSEERTRLLIESAKDYAIFTLDTQRRVVSWSSGAQLMLGYSESEMMGRVGDIVFVPEDRKSKVPEQEIQKAEKEGRAEDERWHLRKDGSLFWGSGITRPLKDEQGMIIGFVKIMRDLTEQRRLQDALRESEEKYRLQLEKEVELRTAELTDSKEQYTTLVDNTPDIITRWDRQLRLVFANKAFERKLGVSIATVLDKTNSEMGLPDEFVVPYLVSLRKAFETGDTVEHFSTSHHVGGENYFYYRLTPEKNAAGEVETVLAIARDITEIKNAEIALKESRDLLQSILDNSFIAMSVLKAVRNESGDILDFEIRLTNKELDRETGRTDLSGKLYAKEFPGIRAAGVFNVMLRVMETGQAEGLEYHYTYEGFDKWYSCMFVKMDDGLVATNMDISERKMAEEYVRKSEEQLRMFVTASSDLIYKMSADCNEMYVVESNNFLQEMGVPATRWMDHYLPAGERSKVQKAIDAAVSAKKLFELEHQILLSDGSIGWANSRAVPLLDKNGEILEWFGVASDITARKSSEDERDKNYLLLQQAEEVANTGTWDYDLLTKTFTWSNGMYRLFNLEKGTPISPTIYREYVQEGYYAAAERVAAYIEQGDSDFEEVLAIKVGDLSKVLKLKATVIRDQKRNPLRVLGVDVDITTSRQAEEKLRRIEAEQQLEIFRVTLRAQEEERRRISESLYNGLGQLLYGIKINVTYINRKKALEDPAEYDRSKAFTEELITQAIKESRNISHELMPSTLEQFGLRSAINDIAEQLNGSVSFHCEYSDLGIRLEKYLELAVFRTVQELMLNVVKHAGATFARVNVSIDNDAIYILVSDNGNGINEKEETKTGIGLSSIRSKVKLLNGTVKINSVIDTGTEVIIEIPIGAL